MKNNSEVLITNLWTCNEMMYINHSSVQDAYDRRKKALRERRKRQLRNRCLLLGTILMIFTISLFGVFSIKSNANENDYNKHYESVLIYQDQDINYLTKTYCNYSYYLSAEDYANEIAHINSINPENIKPGDYVIVPVIEN